MSVRVRDGVAALGRPLRDLWRVEHARAGVRPCAPAGAGPPRGRPHASRGVARRLDRGRPATAHRCERARPGHGGRRGRRVRHALFGPPGIGKSTLLFQVLSSVAATGVDVMLASAEESLSQVGGRAARMGPVPPHLLALEGPDVEAIEAAVDRHRPALVVVDSLQSVSDPELAQPAGSLAQVRACVERLTRLAKSSGVPLLLVGHVTKDGDLAGPRAVEHLVDTVLSFDGDRHHALRVLTSVKHRFGPTGEVGIFEMRDDGLRAVPDPGPLMLGDRMAGVPGSVVVPVLQGRRPLLVEVQALLGPGTGSTGGAWPHVRTRSASTPPGRTCSWPCSPAARRGRPGAGRVLRRRRRRHHGQRAGGRPGRRAGHGIGRAPAPGARRPRGVRGARPRRRGPHRSRGGPPPGRGAPRRIHPGAGARLGPRRHGVDRGFPAGLVVHGVRTLAEALELAGTEAGAQTGPGTMPGWSTVRAAANR